MCDYAQWWGRSVVLVVSTAELQVPLRGEILSESSRAVRFRVERCWDVDIPKDMIAEVRADSFAAGSDGVLEPNKRAAAQ